MGWALNYGGSLSRQTRGASADEAFYGYINNATTIANSFTSQSQRGIIYNQQNTNGEYDLIPDKFLLNANGVSGSFIFNYNDLQNPLIQKMDDIKIEYLTEVTLPSNAPTIVSFIVTDANGIKYYFGKSINNRPSARNLDYTIGSYVFNDQNGAQPPVGGDFPYPNSWQLMDIVTPDGNIIEFYYEKEELHYYSRSNDEVVNSLPQTSYSKIRSEQYQIKEIVFRSGKVKFIKSASIREDVSSYSGSYANVLDRVEILDNNNNIVKQFKLTYEYKTAPSSTNEHPYLISQDIKARKRLYLKTVKEFDGAGVNSIPAYSFTYSTQELPSRFSNSQDGWGYFNNADNGSYLTFFNYGSVNVNRAVDTLKSEAGMLKKITFPTGGSTEFIYEHNRGVPSSQMKDVVTASVNPIFSQNVNLSQLDYGTFYNHTLKQFERPLVINNVYGNNIDINVDFYNTTGCTSTEPECMFTIWLQGTGFHLPIYLNTTSAINVPAGNYTLFVKPKYKNYNPFDFNHFFMVSFNWLEQENNQSELVFGGGKRIKRIENKDSNGTLVSFKEYEYLSTGLPSGKILALPNYESINEKLTYNNLTVFEANGASAGVPLSVSNSNTVGYEFVTEYFGEKNNNLGKTEYRFTVFEDSGNFYRFPHTIPTDNEWLRGNLIFQYTYKNNGGNYTLVKGLTNQYLYADDPFYSFPSPTIYTPSSVSYSNDYDMNTFNLSSYGYLKDKRKYRIPFINIKHKLNPNTGVQNLNDSIRYKVYHLTGGTLDKWKTEETVFGDNGETITTTTFSYDYDNNYQLSEQVTTDSKGDNLRTKYHYPLSGPLFSNNRILPPIKTESFKNSTIQSTTYTLIFGGIHNYLPEKIQTSKGVTQALEDRIIYHSYDSKGNPLEVSKKDGTKIYYVWGYSQTQPIAKIEGYTDAQLANVQSLITSAKLASDNDNDTCKDSTTSSCNEKSLRTQLNNLRNSPHLVNAQVTSFTYDPLVGVTSITDPRGQTIYYEYDNFNRLKQVVDKDDNILIKNEYHYKN